MCTYIYLTMSLFICLWTLQVVSISWVLWIVLQWTWKYNQDPEFIFYMQSRKRDYWIILYFYCFPFWGISIVFSMVAGPVCIPTNSAQRFLFQHPCQHFFLFLITAIIKCKLIFHWLAFIWWLLIDFIYLLFTHLHFFFLEMSIQIHCLFLN